MGVHKYNGVFMEMKGFMHTFESIIAVIILIGFLIFLRSNYVSTPYDITYRGYEILEDLDEKGELRDYVVSGDWIGLNSKINIPGYNHSIEFCNQTCIGYKPDKENVWSSVYIIGGKDVYEPYQIKLYIW